jgi:hypothetical protein
LCPQGLTPGVSAACSSCRASRRASTGPDWRARQTDPRARPSRYQRRQVRGAIGLAPAGRGRKQARADLGAAAASNLNMYWSLAVGHDIRRPLMNPRQSLPCLDFGASLRVPVRCQGSRVSGPRSGGRRPDLDGAPARATIPPRRGRGAPTRPRREARRRPEATDARTTAPTVPQLRWTDAVRSVPSCQATL